MALRDLTGEFIRLRSHSARNDHPTSGLLTKGDTNTSAAIGLLEVIVLFGDYLGVKDVWVGCIAEILWFRLGLLCLSRSQHLPL